MKNNTTGQKIEIETVYKKEYIHYEFDYYKMLESFSKEIWASKANINYLKNDENRLKLENDL